MNVEHKCTVMIKNKSTIQMEKKGNYLTFDSVIVPSNFNNIYSDIIKIFLQNTENEPEWYIFESIIYDIYYLYYSFNITDIPSTFPIWARKYIFNEIQENNFLIPIYITNFIHKKTVVFNLDISMNYYNPYCVSFLVIDSENDVKLTQRFQNVNIFKHSAYSVIQKDFDYLTKKNTNIIKIHELIFRNQFQTGVIKKLNDNLLLNYDFPKKVKTHEILIQPLIRPKWIVFPNWHLSYPYLYALASNDANSWNVKTNEDGTFKIQLKINDLILENVEYYYMSIYFSKMNILINFFQITNEFYQLILKHYDEIIYSLQPFEILKKLITNETLIGRVGQIEVIDFKDSTRSANMMFTTVETKLQLREFPNEPLYKYNINGNLSEYILFTEAYGNGITTNSTTNHKMAFILPVLINVNNKSYICAPKQTALKLIRYVATAAIQGDPSQFFSWSLLYVLIYDSDTNNVITYNLNGIIYYLMAEIQYFIDDTDITSHHTIQKLKNQNSQSPCLLYQLRLRYMASYLNPVNLNQLLFNPINEDSRSNAMYYQYYKSDNDTPRYIILLNSGSIDDQKYTEDNSHLFSLSLLPKIETNPHWKYPDTPTNVFDEYGYLHEFKAIDVNLVNLIDIY